MKKISPTTFERIKKELDYLKRVKRREIAERLNEAISFGDLKENAAYHETKDEQAFLEGKIMELEEIIRTSSISETKSSDRVELGSIVTLLSDNEETFEIVSSVEADPINGKISEDSLIGKALLGAKEGEVVKVETPAGETIEYQILKIK